MRDVIENVLSTVGWLVLIAVCLIAVFGCASLPKETLYEEGAYQVLAAVDAAETLDLVQHPGHWHWYETNPVLGKHPSDGRVVTYFAVSGVAHAGVTCLLAQSGAPPWVTRAFELVSIGIETRALANNAERGVSVSFTVRR